MVDTLATTGRSIKLTIRKKLCAPSNTSQPSSVAASFPNPRNPPPPLKANVPKNDVFYKKISSNLTFSRNRLPDKVTNERTQKLPIFFP